MQGMHTIAMCSTKGGSGDVIDCSPSACLDLADEIITSNSCSKDFLFGPSYFFLYVYFHSY